MQIGRRIHSNTTLKERRRKDGNLISKKKKKKKNVQVSKLFLSKIVQY